MLICYTMYHAAHVIAVDGYSVVYDGAGVVAAPTTTTPAAVPYPALYPSAATVCAAA